MGETWFTVDFALGKVLVETGRGEVIRRIRFDLSGDVPPRPSRSPAARLIGRYLSGEKVPLDLEVDLADESSFRRRVYESVIKIPYGEIRTYGEIAAQAGCPKGARAVGQAMAVNPIPLVIPCHRVLSANGKTGGFSSGIELKRYLLRLEGSFS
jgi:methylated-DNA-[protein]-cysteine S-methyltransferase